MAVRLGLCKLMPVWHSRFFAQDRVGDAVSAGGSRLSLGGGFSRGALIAMLDRELGIVKVGACVTMGSLSCVRLGEVRITPCLMTGG